MVKCKFFDNYKLIKKIIRIFKYYVKAAGVENYLEDKVLTRREPFLIGLSDTVKYTYNNLFCHI